MDSNLVEGDSVATFRGSTSNSEWEVDLRTLFERLFMSPTLSGADSEEESVTSASELELGPPENPKGRAPIVVGTEMKSGSEEHSVASTSELRLDHPGNPERWMSLSLVDHRCRKRVSEMKDLDRAISVAREALELCSHAHREQAKYLSHLAVALATRYEQLAEIADLDEAIVLGLRALDLRPLGHPDRSKSLKNIAFDLCTRFKRLGEMADLHMSTDLMQESLTLCPHDRLSWSMYLNNVAAGFFMRYKRFTGQMTDLRLAIILGQEALGFRPWGHPDLSLISDIVHRISFRYKLVGDVQDLDDGITLLQEAAVRLPRDHPDRPYFLITITSHLTARYERLRRTTDLDDAITLEKEILDICPQEHPLWSSSLNDLIFHLSTRYSKLGQLRDLDEAIVLARETLERCPRRHPGRPSSLNNLAAHLSFRYNHLGTMADLDEAIVVGREALDLRPFDHPDWSEALDDLAYYLYTRFTGSHQLQDQEDLFSLYIEVNRPGPLYMTSPSDVFVAKAWVNAAERFNHPTTLLAHETCLRLFISHLATFPSFPDGPPVLKQLTVSPAVDAFSAYLRNRHPEKAVELLEQGRCVFWNQIAPLRFPRDDVIASDATRNNLVDELARLSSRFHDTNKSFGPDQHDHLCHLNFEFQKVVTNIRSIPGLHHFLLPPTFTGLQHAASCGPVIILNASQYGCDALVIFADRQPIHIPLKITKDRVQEMSTRMRSSISILREIWDDVASPVVSILRGILPARSRIWWCPTARFSMLPLHAAGPYRSGEQNLSDIYISSYTPSLTALIRARQQRPSNSKGKRKNILAISTHSDLPPFAPIGTDTLDAISRCVEDLAVLTRLEGSDSCLSRVLEELTRNEWVHLTCHSRPRWRYPFETACMLDDGDLTLRHIIQCKLTNAEFAFLSTSQTNVGDGDCVDEAIHLASAMQFIGFPSVIGTMWDVDDGVTGRIASRFYKHMVDGSGRLDYTRAALALNETMNALVDSDTPLDQRIVYVHIGV